MSDPAPNSMSPDTPSDDPRRTDVRNKPEFHFEAFMESIGVDVGSEHLEETPHRVVEAFRDELFSGVGKNPRRHLQTTFEDYGNDDGDAGFVIVDNIEVKSMCAHHFLPVQGVAHVGYIPSDEVVGLSKLSRVVEEYARRPQVQERLTNQVANAIYEELDPLVVVVTVIADHECMSCRGVREPDSTTRTSAVRGDESGSLEEKFYQLLGIDSRL